MIVRLARQGGRDAVFDIPAQVLRAASPDPGIHVRLADDATVTATGRVREVSPQADPVTRTFQVKVGLNDPPRPSLLTLSAGFIPATVRSTRSTSSTISLVYTQRAAASAKFEDRQRDSLSKAIKDELHLLHAERAPHICELSLSMSAMSSRAEVAAHLPGVFATVVV
jgi:hypothetical protein